MSNCIPLNENHLIFVTSNKTFITDFSGQILSKHTIQTKVSQNIHAIKAVPQITNGDIYIIGNDSVLDFQITSCLEIIKAVGIELGVVNGLLLMQEIQT